MKLPSGVFLEKITKRCTSLARRSPHPATNINFGEKIDKNTIFREMEVTCYFPPPLALSVHKVEKCSHALIAPTEKEEKRKKLKLAFCAFPFFLSLPFIFDTDPTRQSVQRKSMTSRFFKAGTSAWKLRQLIYSFFPTLFSGKVTLSPVFYGL